MGASQHSHPFPIENTNESNARFPPSRCLRGKNLRLIPMFSQGFGLMNKTSARSIHPFRKSTRNQPSLFFGWKRTGDRGPNSAKSYSFQVLPKSGENAMPVAKSEAGAQ